MASEGDHLSPHKYPGWGIGRWRPGQSPCWAQTRADVSGSLWKVPSHGSPRGWPGPALPQRTEVAGLSGHMTGAERTAHFV